MPPKKRKSEGENGAAAKRGRKKKTAAQKGDDFSDSDKEPADIDHEDDDLNLSTDGGYSEVRIEGSQVSGELLFCGGTNWDLIGRNQVPKGVKNLGGPNLWGPHRIEGWSDIKVRTVASGCTACHSIIITTEGKAYSFGRNDKGQLGHGDTKRRDLPTLIEFLKDFNIVDAALGKNHSLCLSDRGTVFAFGENKMGQLGLNNQTQCVPTPTRIKYKGPPIRRVACGGEFSMIADIRGNLYSFGSPECGQLGHNTDGQYFVTSSKLAYACEIRPRKVAVFIEKSREGVQPVNDVDVQDIACGINHTVILDSKNRVFSWGFGGYGRLGHTEPKDELVPRLIKFFDGPKRGAKVIAAGTCYSMAISELGQLYLWGQTKSTGEVAMYPKPVNDLQGWNVRSIGCSNRSIVVAADDSVISWGPSPTYGELGYGEDKPKSSTQPQEVKKLTGIFIEKVSCGYGHTLMIAKNDTEEAREQLKKLPQVAFTNELS
ncbi:protein RCC2 [Lingula anatina]|uniref:Protein RCC2 n=1 Tax=Lingula anatina TaxID=7574 RepID=A0A1S3I6V1_LINAN|nr:protein RCC2 [Lingula anatina]|eukprot:XP_013393987.1 protein RCC2 [Lingula anatina]